MKSVFKFALLFTLIVSGKLAKQPAPAVMAQTVETKNATDTSVMLVHQTLTSESVKPVQEPQQSGLLAKIL